MKKGKLILVLGPSGTGKGTMISMLKKNRKDIFFPLSCTTRKMREGEKDGENYFFISKEEFEKKIENGEFLEFALVHNSNYYGILKKTVLEEIENGKILVREVDIFGFEKIMKNLDKIFYRSLFILPPENQEILIQRIKNRSEISEEEIEKRLESIKNEMNYIHLVDETMENIDGNIDLMYQNFEKKINILSNN